MKTHVILGCEITRTADGHGGNFVKKETYGQGQKSCTVSDTMQK